MAFDRKRLDPFSPEDFLKDAGGLTDFEEAGRIHRAGLLLMQMRERAGLSIEDLAVRLNEDPEEVGRSSGAKVSKAPP